MKRLTPAGVTLMTVLVVALLVTAYFAKRLLAEESTTARIDYREIPVATAPLEPGVEVAPAALSTIRVPPSAVVPEILVSDRALIGRVVKDPIAAGKPIRASQLYPPGERPPLAVSPGMRAVSVSFPARGWVVGGLLRPGQYVDVYLTPRLDDAADPRLRLGVTLTLFTGVRVLATSEGSLTTGDRPGSSESASPSSVTLELSPEDANLLILAREKGDLALSYNPDGKSTDETTESGAAAAAAAAAKNRHLATMDELLAMDGLLLPKKIDGKGAAKPTSSPSTPPASSPPPPIEISPTETTPNPGPIVAPPHVGPTGVVLAPSAGSAAHPFVSETYRGSVRKIVKFPEAGSLPSAPDPGPSPGGEGE